MIVEWGVSPYSWDNRKQAWLTDIVGQDKSQVHYISL